MEEIITYEVTGYPAYFGVPAFKRRITEQQIRSALAKVYAQESCLYSGKTAIHPGNVQIDRHVASLSGKKECERVHYRVTQYGPRSVYPWYSIGANRLNDLVKEGVTWMVCLFFDDCRERVTGSDFEVYYELWRLVEGQTPQSERDAEEGKQETGTAAWREEKRKDGILYRRNLDKRFQSLMKKTKQNVKKGLTEKE